MTTYSSSLKSNRSEQQSKHHKTPSAKKEKKNPKPKTNARKVFKGCPYFATSPTFFLENLDFFFFGRGTGFVTHVDLDCTAILQPQPPVCRDYRQGPPCLAPESSSKKIIATYTWYVFLYKSTLLKSHQSC